LGAAFAVGKGSRASHPRTVSWEQRQISAPTHRTDRTACAPAAAASPILPWIDHKQKRPRNIGAVIDDHQTGRSRRDQA